jgi:hypothetical protein
VTNVAVPLGVERAGAALLGAAVLCLELVTAGAPAGLASVWPARTFVSTETAGIAPAVDR